MRPIRDRTVDPTMWYLLEGRAVIHHRVSCRALMERIVARDPALTETELVSKLARLCERLNEELYEAW
jgi:hypothetical protein